MFSPKKYNMEGQLAKFKAEFKAAEDNLVAQGRKLFNSITKQIFTEHPELKSFGWTQYTPYFNDGDPCVFHMHGSYPTINGFSTNTGEPVDEENGAPEYEALTEKQREDLQDLIGSFLSAIPDETFLAMFGDHVEVLITRHGPVIEEYSHD